MRMNSKFFSLIIWWERENLNTNSFSWENVTIQLNDRSLNNFFLLQKKDEYDY